MFFWKQLLNDISSNIKIQSTSLSRERINLKKKDIVQPRIFFTKERGIDLYDLEELCDSVGWSRRPFQKVKKALRNSFIIVSAWEVKNNQRRLIGFARATSDHAFNATIWDVVIHPRFQGRGLGKGMINYMIRHLKNENISNVTLFADPQVIDFYCRLGFVVEPEGIKGMFWYPN